MDRNTKLLLACIMLVGGVICAIQALSAGSTSLAALAAALLAGVGWFFREFDREESERRRLCQAYASVITIQYHFMRDVLSDDQLDRWLVRAPRIARGFEPESFGDGPAEPYPLLPDAKPHLHLLSAETVDLLGRWHYLDADMVSIWGDLGTKRWSALGAERLRINVADIKAYRGEYRDYGYSALLALAGEVRGMSTDISQFVADGAADCRASTKRRLTAGA